MKNVSFWKPVKARRPKISKKDLNWKQAKIRYPKLHPFGDADRDKVRNWKDCKPFDRKRQGWAHKEYADSIVVKIPIKRAYHLRGQYGKSRKKWVLSDYQANKKAAALRKKAEKKGEWLDYDKSQQMAFRQMAEEEAKKLSKKGYRIKKVGTAGKSRYGGGRSVTGGYVKYSAPTKVYKKEIRKTMRPMHTADLSGSYESSDEKAYIEKLTKAIKSDDPEVGMIKVYKKDLEEPKRRRFGEGRHRILAAKKARQKTIPVEVIEIYDEEDAASLRVQEAKDTLEKDEPKAQALKDFDYQRKKLYEKAEDKELTPEDIEEHELESFRRRKREEETKE